MYLRLLIAFTDKSAYILLTWYTNSFQMHERENVQERMPVHERGSGDREEGRQWWGGVGVRGWGWG